MPDTAQLPTLKYLILHDHWASVMQREREAIDVGALTNMAAGEIKLLSLVMFQSQSRNCYEIQPHEYLT